MPTVVNKELQEGILSEVVDVAERKRKLEDYIRTVDSLNNALLESAARRDIEALRNRLSVPKQSQ
ncbi:MAG TPA: hypothetical protein VMR20_07240 [Verrucomicrobiae bacterium]|nr:hypothetical protein [Verrucomicrobiae bacterium]